MIAAVLCVILVLLAGVAAYVYWRRHADDKSLGGLAQTVKQKLSRTILVHSLVHAGT